MNALAPEHLDDLRRSGLSDATIAALQFEAVRPGDLCIAGAESAFRIPYFEANGTRNCAERWKLFPPIKREHGTQKYHQPGGSDPQLYLPPLQGWQRILRDAHQPLVFSEGEKKCAKACQEGLCAIGVAGTWNWRQRADHGERLTIPLLDQIAWEGRPVELVPDSDAWRPDKQRTVLAGFYALAMHLDRKSVV
jgi:hypothetical protein